MSAAALSTFHHVSDACRTVRATSRQRLTPPDSTYRRTRDRVEKSAPVMSRHWVLPNTVRNHLASLTRVPRRPHRECLQTLAGAQRHASGVAAAELTLVASGRR